MNNNQIILIDSDDDSDEYDQYSKSSRQINLNKRKYNDTEAMNDIHKRLNNNKSTSSTDEIPVISVDNSDDGSSDSDGGDSSDGEELSDGGKLSDGLNDDESKSSAVKVKVSKSNELNNGTTKTSSSEQESSKSDFDSTDEIDFVVSDNNSLQGEKVHDKREQIYDARYYLKKHGSVEFVKHFLPQNASLHDVIQLIETLGYSVYPEIGANDIYNLLDYLKMIFKKVLRTRSKLQSFYSLDHVLEKFKSCNKILIITGAGISTSLGIPDFRSSKGLYSQLEELGLNDPQEVFDLELFHTDPTIFYSVANKILPPKNVYTPLHSFIKLLESKNKLLRNYTQNIDNVEANAGISADKIVQCHGSFATASCVSCGYRVDGDVIRPEIEAKVPSFCPKCKPQRAKYERGEQDYPESFGVLKPDITFFGEDLPGRFHDLIRQDLLDCDLLISIGTSLQVAPVGDIVNRVPDVVPQILINRDLIPRCNFDVSFLGDCDSMAVYLCRELGWDLDHPKVKGFGELSVKCLNEYDGLYSLSS